MLRLGFVLLALGQPLNEYGPPEHGHGLTAQDAADGWISLIDGKTSFGWKLSTYKIGEVDIPVAVSTATFPPGELKGELQFDGLLIAKKRFQLAAGKFHLQDTGGSSPFGFLGEVKNIRQMHFRPLRLKPLLNGKNLDGWQRIDRAKIPEEKRPRWTVNNGALEVAGGPGALEYQGDKFGDGLLQITVRTKARYSNGGLFFRCIPGDFMNGYEAQLHNRCEDKDPGKPSVYSTGGIDDRQNARRLVSRDGVPFVMTVLAHGPHIATWVNGYQTTDWTDTRKQHPNPRQGLRLEAGTIQIQAHDTGSAFEVLALKGAPLDPGLAKLP